MTKQNQSKIDVFTHVVPEKYRDALLKELPANSSWRNTLKTNLQLSDMNERFKVMDKFEDMKQVLTISAPPIEMVVGPGKAVELAKMANDGMAELVARYPDRFVCAAACLPMNDIDAALKEVDRAIKDLGFRGVQVLTPVVDKPMDALEFMPLYEKMSGYDLPLWIHPYREETYADYKSESRSKYRIFHRFGWPYETTAAMARLVYSGVLEKFPNLKFITHHCGAMLPFLESRASIMPDAAELQSGEIYARITKPPLDYFKKFYADTANIRPSGLMCGYQFFGADHIIFGTDMPYGAQSGEFFLRQAMDGVKQMDISEADKDKIFADSARKILKLLK